MINKGLRPAKGIMIAALIAVPFWLLLGMGMAHWLRAPGGAAVSPALVAER